MLCRISIVFMLLVNLMFFARFWRNLSSLTFHASLISSFVSFFAKCFFMLMSLSALVGYGST